MTNSLKRIAIGVAILVLVAGFAAAQTATADLNLTGTVAAEVNVRLDGVGSEGVDQAYALAGMDAYGAFTDDADIGYVLEYFTNLASTDVIVTSANFGVGNHRLNFGTDYIPYVLTIGGTVVATNAFEIVNAHEATDWAFAGTDGVIGITDPGNNILGLDPGAYTDTITFTVQTN